jgi:hypothetical protein
LNNNSTAIATSNNSLRVFKNQLFSKNKYFFFNFSVSDNNLSIFGLSFLLLYYQYFANFLTFLFSHSFKKYIIKVFEIQRFYFKIHKIIRFIELINSFLKETSNFIQRIYKKSLITNKKITTEKTQKIKFFNNDN